MRREYLSEFYFLIFVFIIILQALEIQCENYEFQLTKPMLITSVRTFEQVSDGLFVAQARNGSVILKADKGFGIMGVVQTLNMQDILEPSGCLDFIKMSQINGDEETKEICGHLDSDVASLHSLLSPLKKPSFVDKSGYVELTFGITEKTRLSPLNNITNFNLTFTPFQECPEEAFPFGNGFLRPCSNLDTFSCISAEFWCDGVINCGFPHEFGIDELNCPPENDNEEETKEVKDESEVILPKDLVPILEEEKPYDGYIYENANMVQRKVKYLITKASGRINIGVLATLTIFILLFSLSKMSGSGRQSIFSRNAMIIEPLDYSSDNDNANDGTVGNCSENLSSKCNGAYVMVNSMYDAEKDPVPSYEDCLLDYDYSTQSRPVYCDLSYECERPPSYEEVGVHHWTSIKKGTPATTTTI